MNNTVLRYGLLVCNDTACSTAQAQACALEAPATLLFVEGIFDQVQRGLVMLELKDL